MPALYRKYRPLKLADVVGQDAVIRPLECAIKSGKINHAYLFVGPRGCGKTSVARIFAHEINAFKYEIEDSYVDIIEIDAASNRGIDDIRELREKATIAPTSGTYKVYIIDEVHMLTREAFNALLKTLEEPPEHVVFIMATTNPEKLPITITSRAQKYLFSLAPAETMLSHLKTIAAAEKITIDDDALEIIVRRGGGSFRDSISLLDQISSLSTDQITADMVTTALGLPSEELTNNILTAYRSRDLGTITTALRSSLNTGTKPESIAAELITRIIEKPDPALLPLLTKLPSVSAPFPEAKLLVACLDGLVSTPGARAGVSQPIHDTLSRAQTGVVQPAHEISSGTRIKPEVVTESSIEQSPRAQAQTRMTDEGFARREPTLSSEQVGNSNPSEPTLPNEQVNNSSSSEPTPSSEQTDTPSFFDWDTFVNSLSAILRKKLNATTHEVKGTTVYIYADASTKSILNSPNNRKKIDALLNGYGLIIEDKSQASAPATPTNVNSDATKNPTFQDSPSSPLNAIMGNVEELDETNGIPF